jgi:hypothetical protein
MPERIPMQALPPEVAQKLEARRETMISRLEHLSDRDEKLLFELEWLTPKQVKWAMWRLRIRSLEMIVELLLLFAAILGVAWIATLLSVGLLGM